MNRQVTVWMILVAVRLWFAPLAAQAHYEVAAGISIGAAGDFYEPLGAYGTWVQVGSYGRCWHPSYVAADWRPYCDGHWEWTDNGWYWESDEQWSWACYHYGRWTYDSYYGWVWVPGVEWAPCWVAWRFGDGYCGWAPLPPECVFVDGVIDVDRVRFASSAFVFIDERHFCDPIRRSTVIINNERILNKTVNVTKIRVVNKTVTVNGPNVNTIQERTGRTVPRAQAASLWQQRSERVISRASQEHWAAPPARQMPGRETPTRATTPTRETPSRETPERRTEPPASQPRPSVSPREPERQPGQVEPARPAPSEQPRNVQPEPRSQPAPTAPPERQPNSWWPFGRGRQQPATPPPERQPGAGQEPGQSNRGYYYRRQPVTPAPERAAPERAAPERVAPAPERPAGGREQPARERVTPSREEPRGGGAPQGAPEENRGGGHSRESGRD